MMQSEDIVVGGGFYGCSLAERLARSEGRKVILVEREADLMNRASYANQARVHCGYHYPRGLMTALRSRVNLPRFVEDWKDCIVDGFEHYYAVARRFSKVSAAQFELFCDRIGAPLEPAPPAVRSLFDEDFIEGVWRVVEPCFDARKLRDRVRERLDAAGVQVRTGTWAETLTRRDGRLRVALDGAGREALAADRVWLCTYSALNRVLAASGLPIVPLKHEFTEMALVVPPPALADKGVTVMCGPFFSMLPFPALGLSTLSHVRYTPHGEWHDRVGEPLRDPFVLFESLARETAAPLMVKDARRYLPALEDLRRVDSIWETKTVLPANEVDDGRPILFRLDHGLPGLNLVMGSKIDNVYDVMDLVHA